MLAVISSGNSGVMEYLESGQKTGQTLKRDDIDNRISICGNFDLTKSIIESIENKGQERYSHVTLSFKEDNISIDDMKKITTDYIEQINSAYHQDEFNAYAEIHYPKIKHYEDKKTGELIERKPHVHIVLPRVNLQTNKHLNQFPTVDKDLKFYDAIQENINNKYSLASPKDNKRHQVFSKSNAIEAYRNSGKPVRSAKREVLEQLTEDDFLNYDSFKKGLSDLKGFTLKTVNSGKDNEYLNVKKQGEKGINFNDPQFKKSTFGNVKKEPKEYERLVSEWKETRSKELKYIMPQNQQTRARFYSQNKQDRQEVLNLAHIKSIGALEDGTRTTSRATSQRNGTRTTSRAASQRNGARTTSRAASQRNGARTTSRAASQRNGARNRTEPIKKRDIRKPVRNRLSNIVTSVKQRTLPKVGKLSDTPHRLPSMSTRNMARNAKELPQTRGSLQNNRKQVQSVLSANELYSMGRSRGAQANQLRRALFDRGRGRSAISTTKQELTDKIHLNSDKLSEFKKLPPKLIFNELKTKNFYFKEHKYFKKNTEYRIDCGKRKLNPIDFLTKEVNLKLSDAIELLNDVNEKALIAKTAKQLRKAEPNHFEASFLRGSSAKEYNLKLGLAIFERLKEQEYKDEKTTTFNGYTLKSSGKNLLFHRSQQLVMADYGDSVKCFSNKPHDIHNFLTYSEEKYSTYKLNQDIKEVRKLAQVQDGNQKLAQVQDDNQKLAQVQDDNQKLAQVQDDNQER